jgi:hypothetical protein
MPDNNRKLFATAFGILLPLAMTTAPIHAAQAAPAAMSASQLAPLLAPVALYPDPLLAQVLNASQYPDQITAAARWLRANPRLRGAAAAKAAARRPWSASVRSLVAFPDVLAAMDAKPAWVRSLGAAYKYQSRDVLDEVQVLRAKARGAGHLASTSQQKIVVSGSYISIEPVSPQVVYVPAYDVTRVYGTWAYAAPPAVIWPSTVAAAGIAFGLGVAVGNAHWGDIDWRSNSTVVNNYYSDNSYYSDTSVNVYSDHSDNSVNVYSDNSDNSVNVYSNNSVYDDGHGDQGGGPEPVYDDGHGDQGGGDDE